MQRSTPIHKREEETKGEAELGSARAENKQRQGDSHSDPRVAQISDVQLLPLGVHHQTLCDVHVKKEELNKNVPCIL